VTADHRNKLQLDCSGDPEFVLGEIYGLRQWQLHAPATDPYIVGHHGGRWDLYETNLAICEKTSEWLYRSFSLSSADFTQSLVSLGKAVAYFARSFFEENTEIYTLTVSLTGAPYPSPKLVVTREVFRNFDVTPDLPIPWDVDIHLGRWRVGGILRETVVPLEFKIAAETPVPPHTASFPICTCGFYAYTDSQSLLENSQTHGDTVFGLVKAYGHVTQGPKGFRAQKAEVVALTKPQTARSKDKDTRPTFVPQFFGLGIPSSQAEWVPNTEDKTVLSGFNRLVPDTISILDTLDDLLQLAEHFLEPPDAEAS
jgi:hypothetical protein